MKKEITWIFLDVDEIYDLKPNEKIIGTHLAPPTGDTDDEYGLVLVIENEGGLK